MNSDIPVTVGILTYNSSIATVGDSIRSVLGFREILLCDARSTDGTRELATSLGCRIIDQAEEFLDDAGRLVNEAGVNEQVLAAATFDWVFFLDHDEIATPELVDEIRQVVSGPRTHGAFEVPRLYVVDGHVIDCATNYPTSQIRLVHRDAVEGYGGIIHSPVIMSEDETVGMLSAYQLVPLPPLKDLWSKWIGYMRLEEIQKSDLDRSMWWSTVAKPALRRMRWLIWKILKIRRTCMGRPMPIRYEVGRIGYEMGVLIYTGRRFLGLGRPDPTKVWA